MGDRAAEVRKMDRDKLIDMNNKTSRQRILPHQQQLIDLNKSCSALLQGLEDQSGHHHHRDRNRHRDRSRDDRDRSRDDRDRDRSRREHRDRDSRRRDREHDRDPEQIPVPDEVFREAENRARQVYLGLQADRVKKEQLIERLNWLDEFEILEAMAAPLAATLNDPFFFLQFNLFRMALDGAPSKQVGAEMVSSWGPGLLTVIRHVEKVEHEIHQLRKILDAWDRLAPLADPSQQLNLTAIAEPNLRLVISKLLQALSDWREAKKEMAKEEMEGVPAPKIALEDLEVQQGDALPATLVAHLDLIRSAPGGQRGSGRSSEEQVLIEELLGARRTPETEETVEISLQALRYSQKSIGARLRNGHPLQKLIAELSAGSVSANELDMVAVEWEPSRYYVLSNRRLYCCKEALSPSTIVRVRIIPVSPAVYRDTGHIPAHSPRAAEGLRRGFDRVPHLRAGSLHGCCGLLGRRGDLRVQGELLLQLHCWLRRLGGLRVLCGGVRGVPQLPGALHGRDGLFGARGGLRVQRELLLPVRCGV